MIPGIRALLNTSWDPKIRQALAKERADNASNPVNKAGRPTGSGRREKVTVVGTMAEENEVVASGDGGTSGDLGGGGGDSAVG